jgi:hypothetical protein
MLDLDLYTDPAAMRPALQSLRGLSSQVRRVDVLHATRRAPRRDPASRACRIAVCYRVETAARGHEILYGKVYPGNVCAELTAGTGVPPAPEWLREIDMIFWRFPHDPGLPQLGALLDGRTELVRYRPEERATLRRGDLYAKTFRGDDGAGLCARFQQLALISNEPGSFEVAAPFSYDASTRTFWQQGIEAPALAEVITSGNCAALMALAAQGLAALHGAEPRFGPARSNAELAAASLRRAAKIGRCMPRLGPQAQGVAEAIAGHVPAAAGHVLTAASEASVQIHGDFHMDQLRVREGRLVLFDLDELAIGDPLEDLASFVVKCPLRDARLARQACAALIEAYARCRPALFDAARLSWHLSVQWLHKASRAYVWQRPGWRAAAEEALAQAEQPRSALT